MKAHLISRMQILTLLARGQFNRLPTIQRDFFHATQLALNGS